MEPKTFVFSISLVLVFAAAILFIGVSYTGYVSMTMHCDGDDCNSICRFDTDCIIDDEVCCDQGGYGVCQAMDDCISPYYYMPGADEPVLEQPRITRSYAGVYAFLAVFVMVLVAAFILVKKH